MYIFVTGHFALFSVFVRDLWKIEISARKFNKQKFHRLILHDFREFYKTRQNKGHYANSENIFSNEKWHEAVLF